MRSGGESAQLKDSRANTRALRAEYTVFESYAEQTPETEKALTHS